LKVSANVKIAMQCFEIFGGEYASNAPLVARLHVSLPAYTIERKLATVAVTCSRSFSSRIDL